MGGVNEEQKLEQPCDHPVVDEGKCMKCQQPVANPTLTFDDLLKDVLSADRTTEFNKLYVVDLGEIWKIGKLADETWEVYDALATANETPGFPQQPRLRMVGGRMMRIGFHQIWKEVVEPSYFKAKQLGYRGTYHDWEQYVKEANRERPPRKNS